MLKLKAAQRKAVQNATGIIVDRIEMVDIDSVKLWEGNPRKNDKAVTAVMKSIKEYGQKTPIVVWDQNDIIYKGNTTWNAISF